MAKFTGEYTKHRAPLTRDGRLDTPAFQRNHRIITEQLTAILGGRRGDVLEIGSGSGQHITAFARAMPRITWWPTDPDPKHIKSIDAWRQHEKLDNLAPPARLDATQPRWTPHLSGAPLAEGLTAIICINVVHITPWNVSLGLLGGAGRHLKTGGRLVLYGPFKRDGAHTAPSNAAFDKNLQAKDPAWGVRDMTDLVASASDHGLDLDQIIPVPANNFILVFDKAGDGTAAQA